MTNVYYAVVNIKHVMHKKKRRKKKQITFHIKSYFMIPCFQEYLHAHIHEQRWSHEVQYP